MTDSVDVLVVGAGINGAGVAQAAAAAGYSVRVLEQYEAPAQGTSSRSSKLIHGGLRYLEGGHVALVRECLRERALLLANAPELVHLVPMHLPIYAAAARGPATVWVGLALYRMLDGLGPASHFQYLARAEWSGLDGLATDGLRAVFRYFEAQTDDAALTRAVLASAERLGAQVTFRAEVQHLVVASDGVHIDYRSASAERSVRARTVVNAAGPWAGAVLGRVRPAQQAPMTELVRGTHVAVPGRLTQGAYYVESPRDGRPVFVLPWRDETLIGTTEVVYTGDPACVRPTDEEVEYLLEAFHHHFTRRTAAPARSYAGLRVLPAGPGRLSARSRETRLVVDRRATPRLLTIFGGKLTAYRATAERALSRLRTSLPPARRLADTAALPLPPAPGDECDGVHCAPDWPR